ncbi:hypothetical protein [Daejeonella sp.]|uniref:hypothetical protein n=1 Tax=Daejeonella sp. TaxID=2805397 RepID=UPI0030BB134F
MNNGLTTSADSYLKTLKLMYVAFLSSQVLFIVAVLISQKNAYFSLQDEGNVYLYIAPFLAVAGFLGGKTIFQNQLADIAGKASLKEKLAAYSSAFLVRVAFMEAPTLFATIAFFLTGNLACLAVAALMILYFLTLSPGREKVEEDLELSFQEKAVWDANQVIS